MKSLINTQLIGTTTFDSGALGPLAMLIHRFVKVGRYRAAVLYDDVPVGETSFSVDDDSTVMQLDLDLAAVRREKARAAGCDCDARTASTTPQTVSPKGYVLFYASSGTGHAVTVFDDTGTLVFDSRRLAEGALYALSPLEPARYSVLDKASNAKGELLVTLTEEAAKRIKILDPINVKVAEAAFEPQRVELTASQGLIFHLKGPGRIVIEKQQDDPESQTRAPLRWRRMKLATAR